MRRTGKRSNRIDVVVRRDNWKAALRINGRLIDASPTQIAVLATLLDQKGMVVPYERLCRAIGREVVRGRHIHILRQYVGLAKQVLSIFRDHEIINEVSFDSCR